MNPAVKLDDCNMPCITRRIGSSNRGCRQRPKEWALRFVMELSLLERVPRVPTLRAVGMQEYFKLTTRSNAQPNARPVMFLHEIP